MADKSELGWLDEIISEAMQKDEELLSPVDFCREILGMYLFPAQRTIMKAFYGLPFTKGAWGDCIDPSDPERLVKLKEWGHSEDEEFDEAALMDKWLDQKKALWVPGQRYKNLSLESGMGSSKSSITGGMSAYEFYRLTKMEDPGRQLGLIAGDPIFVLSIATNEQQAKDTIFAYTKARMESSAYFGSMIERGDIVVLTTEIVHRKKNVIFRAGHSRGAGLVGKNLWGLLMDEVNRFAIEPGASVESSGLALWNNVGKGTTRFKHSVDGGVKIGIGSAWQEGDMSDLLWRQVENGEVDPREMMCLRLCTWDVNPNYTGRDDPHLQTFYASDPIGARRDYEGIRPGAQEDFFNKEILDRYSIGKQVGKYYPTKLYDVAGKGVVENGDVSALSKDQYRSYVGIQVVDVEEMMYPNFSYAHADPGIVNDSFGFAVGHGEPTDKGLLAIIDLVLEWAPEMDKDDGKTKIPVNVTDVEEKLLSVCSMRNTRRLSFDHWNAAGSVQRLYTKGIVTEQVTFTAPVQLAMYETLRHRLDNGLVVLPDPESSPAAKKLYWELRKLQLVNGRKVDHPKGRALGCSKDLADCFVGSTKVSLLDGRELTFLELVEEFGDGTPFYVYACDPKTHAIQVGKAYAPRLARVHSEVVAVTLDNGEVVKCTPDHRFLLRDGSWCEAKDLKAGTSLMPLYRKTSEKVLKGYEMYLDPADQKYHYTHRLVGKYKYPNEYPTPGRVLHHARGKRNNDPAQLELVSKQEHGLKHAEDLKARRQNPEFEQKRVENFLTYARGEGREVSRQNMQALWSDPGYQAKMRDVHAEIGKVTGPRNLTSYNQSAAHRNQARERLQTGVLTRSGAENNRARTDITLERIKQAFSHATCLRDVERELTCDARVIRRVLAENGLTWRELLPQVINHKVVSVAPAGFEDVYDLSVEGWENFALTAGVFVHNCVAAVVYRIAQDEKSYGLGGFMGVSMNVIGQTRVSQIKW